MYGMPFLTLYIIPYHKPNYMKIIIILDSSTYLVYSLYMVARTPCEQVVDIFEGRRKSWEGGGGVMEEGWGSKSQVMQLENK